MSAGLSRRLGDSDLDVFPLALGGNTFGWTSDADQSHAVLDRFVEGGGNLIDTADGYSSWADGNSGGESEQIIGSWMRKRGTRDAVVIATKVGQHPDFPSMRASNIAAAADASLSRLGTDRIDLYFAHDDDPTVDLSETIAAFDALVSAGKVRYVGLSNYSPGRVKEWLAVADAIGARAPVALEPHYNLLRRSDYETGYAPIAQSHNLGAIPYFALASGFLTGKYRTAAEASGAAREGMIAEYFNDASLRVLDVLDAVASDHESAPATVALAWLLTRPAVVAPIASARVVGQVAALLAAPHLILTDAEVTRLTEVSS
jgi:aryl-alcohol dehydrogenase-like predicted oxidoreductase